VPSIPDSTIFSTHRTYIERLRICELSIMYYNHVAYPR
jgi:hypothetical protein